LELGIRVPKIYHALPRERKMIEFAEGERRKFYENEGK